MAQYIDKAALIAEIESKRKYAQTLGDNAINSSMQQFYDGMKQSCVDILSFLDTLEVKEVDLEKEIKRLWEKHSYLNMDWLRPVASLQFPEFSDIAKHFCKLGMRLSNPITTSDRGMAEEIIINLKRVEQDYHINLTREMEWLRNQVKKEK